MQKYTIMVKNDSISNQVANDIKKVLDLYCEYDDINPSLVISIGGDGTMLASVHRFHTINPIFVGIHTGTLGFYTDFVKEELDQLIQVIRSNQYDIIQRHMLDIIVKDKEKEHCLVALNEVRIDHGYRTQVFDVLVDDELLETYRGNGVCVSTPSGSTAYNKALGGSVVFPDLAVMQLTEVASINHNAYRCLGSSLILGSRNQLVFNQFVCKDISIGIDHTSYKFDHVDYINVCLSPNPVRFMNAKNLSFVGRLKRAFIC